MPEKNETNKVRLIGEVISEFTSTMKCLERNSIS